jgi:hypothetical protein
VEGSAVVAGAGQRSGETHCRSLHFGRDDKGRVGLSLGSSACGGERKRQSFDRGFRPIVFSPRTLVRTWGTPGELWRP